MFAQKDNVKEAFLEKWNNSKYYLVAIAEAMPEEKYGYAPTEREMSFEAQLLHMRGNMLWLGNTYFSSKGFDRKSLSQNIPEGKSAVISALKKPNRKTYLIVKS